MNTCRLLSKFTTFLLLLGLTNLSSAQTVSQKIEDLNIFAEAEYMKGEPQKPAILLLHGFLTTNKFHTITSISNALNDEGYTTLSPTLTLDIANRQNNVKCSSIHTHSLEKDITEIHDWRNWLKQQGHNKVIVLGHSSGSSQLLEYLSRYPESDITGAIFTSLFYLNGEEVGSNEADINKAKAQREQKQNSLYNYSLLFCANNYLSTAEGFLSYVKHDREYVLNQLKTLQLPNYTIIGSADKRLIKIGGRWNQELESTKTNLVLIDGANHFFSSEHEFDLQEKLIDITDNLSK